MPRSFKKISQEGTFEWINDRIRFQQFRKDNPGIRPSFYVRTAQMASILALLIGNVLQIRTNGKDRETTETQQQTLSPIQSKAIAV